MKVMKKFLTGGMIVMMVLFLSAGLGLAGNANGQGAGDGTGPSPIHNILDGTPFDYTGEVVSCASGEGLVLAIDEENIIIYGIGPNSYWELQGVEKPGVGETVSVMGNTVDFNGELLNIATSITIGEDTVYLRDLETGLPLWRGQKKGQVQE